MSLKKRYLQFDILRVVEQLKQVVELPIHIVVVHQSRHWDLVLQKTLVTRIFHQFVMSVQNVVYIHFLSKGKFVR